MTDQGQTLLEQLLTEDLSGVTFVRDYLQLQFNPPPHINVYSRCAVHIDGRSFTFGEEPFANALLSLIGKKVTAVSQADEVFTITFEGNASITISFADGSFPGPEAFDFWGREKRWGVWPG